MAVSRLPPSEILAYCAGIGLDPEPWEFEILVAGTAAYCSAFHKRDEREPNYNDEAPKPSAIKALAEALSRKNK